MAGTVVDVLMEGVASATTGINTGTPVIGGTLNVGLGSDDASTSTPVSAFTGSTGKLDAAGFCIANAVYDSLFLTSANGLSILPNLGVSIVGSNSYKTWTVKLRTNVHFHDNTAFNATAVAANFTAAYHNTTVGQAIQPLIASCVVVSPTEVKYTTVLPFYSFPYVMSESQIGYMANPKMFVNGFSGTPSGTGPFKYSQWTPQSTSTWVKNTTYWRKDSSNRALPYLQEVVFHTLQDPDTRYTALVNNTVQIAVFGDGPNIQNVDNNSSLSKLSSLSQNAVTSPGMNCLMCNVTSKNYLNQLGHFDVGTGTFVTGTASPIGNVLIREALAYAIETTGTNGYLNRIDNNQGAASNGIFQPGNPYYANPGYPTYNPTTARTKVGLYTTQTGDHSPSVVVHTLPTAYANAQFAFLQNAASAVGITLVQYIVTTQSEYIDTYAVFKEYETILWSQFGGVNGAMALNYVWWDSSKLSNHSTAPGFRNTSTAYSGFVNFANNVDAAIETAMVAALAAHTVASQAANWKTVNDRFAADIPYLWLDVAVGVWAARSTVQNWAGAKAPSSTSVKSSTAILTPDGGTLLWAQTWLS
jgi:peptide/nickel transport system substrate-binding protein